MGKLRILIADDSHSVRRAIARYLRVVGHVVTEASTGVEAVALMNDNIDIVVLDVQMPEMGGVEAAKKIQVSHPSVPLFALTGFPELIGPVNQSLFAEVLTKPMDGETLHDFLVSRFGPP
jgi:CheY-like chemotaxis protein